MTAPETEALDGLLLVDKPGGPTSHDVVAAIRRQSGERRVGHAGTLDPLATGLLPLVLGAATRLVRFLPADPKVYLVSVRLGLETTTGDSTGEALGPERAVAVGIVEIERALAALTGRIDQVPPMYSARKVKGERLYRAARAGREVARAATAVTIHEIRLLGRDLPGLDLEVHCSPGTYIRSLVVELGRTLGVGATVTGLRRVQSGTLLIGAAAPLAALADRAAIRAATIPLDGMPLALASATLEAAAALAFASGRSVPAPAAAPAAAIAVRSPAGRLVGIGEARPGVSGGSTLEPRVVIDRSRGGNDGNRPRSQ